MGTTRADCLFFSFLFGPFLLDARFELLDDEVVAVRGPDAAEVVAAAGLAAVEGRCRVAGDLLVISRGDGVIDLAGPARPQAAAVAALREAGARDGDPQDLIRWRVDAGVPAWGAEVVAPHLPEEAGLLPTHVHLGKGCYPGQEAVARMWMLGRPRRRLAVVAAKGAQLAEGWETGTGRHKVTVTTVTPEADRALAYVPSDAEPGATYGEDGQLVEVVVLVGASDTPPGHDPAMTRRRDRPRT
jgi:tRNA-modifying protein YgfZ